MNTWGEIIHELAVIRGKLQGAVSRGEDPSTVLPAVSGVLREQLAALKSMGEFLPALEHIADTLLAYVMAADGLVAQYRSFRKEVLDGGIPSTVSIDTDTRD